MENLRILFAAPVAVQLLIDGILIGAVFALAAYGMALVWGVTNIINIAQGEFVILGGYVTLYVQAAGLHPLFAVPVAAIALFAVGWVIYEAVIFRVVDMDASSSLLATFGISILLQQLMDQGFGGDLRTAESGLGTRSFFNDRITVSDIKVVAFLIVLVLGVYLAVFLKRSRMGQAIRATAQNRRAARVMGINTGRVFSITFALNAAICGATGALVAMIWTIHPFYGLIYTIRAFVIVVVAGLGNIAGVVAAGLGLGAAEQFAGFILGSEFQQAFVFSLLVVILVARNLNLKRQRKYLA